MKLVLLVLFALIVTINANPVHRTCKCKALSDTIHVKYHEWDISSCSFCSCSDAAMVNCESACQSMVQSYANAGCGAGIKGSKVIYEYKASTCGNAKSTTTYTCA